MSIRFRLVVASVLSGLILPVWAYAGDEFESLKGAEQIGEVRSAARTIGRGGRISDVRFAENEVYFRADAWKKIDLTTGEVVEGIDAEEFAPTPASSGPRGKTAKRSASSASSPKEPKNSLPTTHSRPFTKTTTSS